MVIDKLAVEKYLIAEKAEQVSNFADFNSDEMDILFKDKYEKSKTQSEFLTKSLSTKVIGKNMSSNLKGTIIYVYFNRNNIRYTAAFTGLDNKNDLHKVGKFWRDTHYAYYTLGRDAISKDFHKDGLDKKFIVSTSYLEVNGLEYYIFAFNKNKECINLSLNIKLYKKHYIKEINRLLEKYSKVMLKNEFDIKTIKRLITTEFLFYKQERNKKFIYYNKVISKSERIIMSYKKEKNGKMFRKSFSSVFSENKLDVINNKMDNWVDKHSNEYIMFTRKHSIVEASVEKSVSSFVGVGSSHTNLSLLYNEKTLSKVKRNITRKKHKWINKHKEDILHKIKYKGK